MNGILYVSNCCNETEYIPSLYMYSSLTVPNFRLRSRIFAGISGFEINSRATVLFSKACSLTLTSFSDTKMSSPVKRHNFLAFNRMTSVFEIEEAELIQCRFLH